METQGQSSPRRTARSRATAAVLWAALAATSCHQQGAERVVAVTVWPAPPAPARVGFLASVPGEQRHERPWYVGLWRLLIGEDEPEAQHEERTPRRPFGVDVLAGTLVVADPDAPGLWRGALGQTELALLRCDGLFEVPLAVAEGPGGHWFVADAGAGALIEVDPAGSCLGAVAADLLERPTDVEWLADRQLFAVVDAAAHHVVLLSAAGELRGTVGSRGEGARELNFPTHLARAPGGELLVVDAMNFKIKAFGGEGDGWLRDFGEAGDAPGRFWKPKGIAVDSEGHIYVADAMQDQIFVFDAHGAFLLAFGGPGAGAGALSLPAGVAIDAQDRIYVADSMNRRVQVYQYLGAEARP